MTISKEQYNKLPEHLKKHFEGGGNTHVSVKPIALMQYLIKLVCPPNGIVLEPFMGSGTTILAAINLGVNYIAYEKEKEYFDIATARIAAYKSQGKLEF